MQMDAEVAEKEKSQWVVFLVQFSYFCPCVFISQNFGKNMTKNFQQSWQVAYQMKGLGLRITMAYIVLIFAKFFHGF